MSYLYVVWYWFMKTSIPECLWRVCVCNCETTACSDVSLWWIQNCCDFCPVLTSVAKLLDFFVKPCYRLLKVFRYILLCLMINCGVRGISRPAGLWLVNCDVMQPTGRWKMTNQTLVNQTTTNNTANVNIQRVTVATSVQRLSTNASKSCLWLTQLHNYCPDIVSRLLGQPQLESGSPWENLCCLIQRV